MTSKTIRLFVALAGALSLSLPAGAAPADAKKPAAAPAVKQRTFATPREAADAIIAAAEKKVRGVYNVSGPPPLPLSIIVREAGRTAIPVPEVIFRMALGRFGLPTLATGAIAHLKYPIVIDSLPFRKLTGFRFTYDAPSTLEAFAKASPVA